MEATQPNHILENQDSIFTCEICIEPVYQSKRFKNKETCAHDSYCVTCIARYIEAKIEEHNTGDIKCPGLECENFLDPLCCHSILQSRVFERWCDALFESWILDRRYRKSQCPYPHCSTMYVTDCTSLSRITCLKCKKKFCVKCRKPTLKKGAHYCQRYKEVEVEAELELQDENDARVVRLATENSWKRCPRCGFIVEKRSGCEHMKCRCGTKFNYHSGRVESSEGCPCTSCGRKFWVVMLCCFAVFFCLYGLCFWALFGN